MSTQHVELSVNAAPNNRGIIAANNYGNQHNHFHNYNAEQAKNEASIRLRDSFFLSDPVIDRRVLEAAKGARVPGTFDWIYGNAAYRAWLSGSSSILWITGSPGKGKTMMAMYLADQLEKGIAPRIVADGQPLPLSGQPLSDNLEPEMQIENVTKHTIRPVYAFFCRSDDEKRNSAVAVLRGMIYQILSNEPTLSHVISKDMEGENRSSSTLTSKEALWSMFEKLSKNVSVPVTYCVLDGLDECDQDSTRFLRQRILGPRDGSTGAEKIRWLIVSRDIGDIHSCGRISLDHLQEEVDQDIKRVIHFTFENTLSSTLDTATKLRVKDDVMRGAGGTFLWAGYIAHELSQRKTKKDILQSLRSLPKDLNALYDRMLCEIPTGDQQMCATLLMWLSLALEPLRLNDLAEALELKTTQETTALEELDYLIQQCGHIVQVSGNTVSLVHQSAKDYLFDRHAMQPGTAIFRVDSIEGHCAIASRCIRYLENTGYLDDMSLNTLDDNREQCAFFAYVIDHWAQHVHASSTKFGTLATRYPRFFDLTSGRCFKSIKCREYERLISYKLDKRYPMLVAAAEGILEWARYLYASRLLWALRHPVFHSSWKKEAMNLAITFGHLDIVGWLLDIGYDVNARAYGLPRLRLKNRTLVFAALDEDNYDLVHLLVQRGALVYGESVHTMALQDLGRKNYYTAGAWRQVFVGAFIRQAHHADPEETHQWIKYCIEMNEPELLRQLLAVDVDLPCDDYDCVLEKIIGGVTFDDSIIDIWPTLVQRVVDQDKNFRAVHGRAGHRHTAGECGAPARAIYCGNTFALRKMLSHKCFITAIQLSPYHGWCWMGDGESPSYTEIIATLIDSEATNERTFAWILERREYESGKLLLLNGVDPNAERVFYRRSYGQEMARMTPLFYAECIQDDTMIALLTRFGAQLSSGTTWTGKSIDESSSTMDGE